MSVAFADCISPNFSQTNATSYVTASGTAQKGALQLIACLSDMAAATPPVATVTHSGGATVAAVLDVTYNTTGTPRSRLSVYRFMPTADVSGTLTFDFGANTQINCIWSWVQVFGLDTSGTNGANAIVQSVSNNGDGIVSGAPGLVITLAAGASSRNPVYGFNGQDKGTLQSTTPGSGYTQLDNRPMSTEVNRLTTQYRLDFSTTCDCTFSTTLDTGGIALELKIAPSMLAMIGAG